MMKQIHTDRLDPTEEQKARMLHNIREGHVQPNRLHRRNRVRRFAALLCAVLVAATSAVIAGGTPFGLQSSRRPKESWSDFGQTASYADKHVPGMKYVESFSTGYTFEKGFAYSTDVKDESWNTIGSYTSIYLHYRNGSQSINLHTETDRNSTAPVSHPEWYRIRIINGIPVYYREWQTISLPSDTQPTPEEEEKYNSGEININWDAQLTSRTESIYYFIKWTENGIDYLLSTYYPGALTEDDFFQMAEEIITS